MMRRRSRRRGHPVAELNITAFMNLMVVLVPFLLITAVFSRITILQLGLPAEGRSAESQKPTLGLEVVLRANSIDVATRKGGMVRRIAADDGYDFAALGALMREIKARHPDTRAATILLEPQVPYEVLIQAMDVIRMVRSQQDGQQASTGELFPEIAVGDAPLRTSSAQLETEGSLS